MVLGNFQCRGVLLIWIIVRQGPSALVLGADGVVLAFFLSSVTLKEDAVPRLLNFSRTFLD